jgi:predicted N-acyltransferase
MELHIVDRIATIDPSEWNALVSAEDAPFVEWEWLAGMEETRCVGGDSGWHPVHFTFREGGKLVAAAPAYVKENSEGEFVYDWGWAEAAQRAGIPYYPKLVFAVPFTPATGPRVLGPTELRTALVPVLVEASRTFAAKAGISGVHVLFPREDEAATWERAGMFQRLGIQFHFHNDGYKSFEDFLTRMPSKKRTQLRRERAQPAKDKIEIATHPPVEPDKKTVKTMYELYLTTVDKFVWGRRYLTPKFFEWVASRYFKRLAWVLAKREGKLIASAFNVKKGERLYGRYWGTFEEHPFLHFNVCYYHGVDECIREGLRVFEPGAGGEHKRVRGFLPTIMHSAHSIEHPQLARAIKDYVRREASAVREQVEEERAESKLTPQKE